MTQAIFSSWQILVPDWRARAEGDSSSHWAKSP